MIQSLKKYTQYFLIGVLIVFIAGEVFELIVHLFRMITSIEDGERFIFSREENSVLLVIFFSIVIALELIDTLLPINDDELDKVKLILLVSLIALGRKFITVDFKHTDDLQILGLAALTIAIAGAYYILKKSGGDGEKP